MAIFICNDFYSHFCDMEGEEYLLLCHKTLMKFGSVINLLQIFLKFDQICWIKYTHTVIILLVKYLLVIFALIKYFDIHPQASGCPLADILTTPLDRVSEVT